MYKKIFFSITFLNILAITFVYLLLKMYLGSSLFGQEVETGWLGYFFFNIKNPLKDFGLPSLLSFYAHVGFKHYILNIFLYAVISSRCEQKWGSLFTLILTFLLHVITLAILVFYFLNIDSADKIVYGASGAIVGLIAFYLSFLKKWIVWFLVLCGLLWAGYKGISMLTLFEPHMISFILGTAITPFLIFWLKSFD